MNKVMLKLAFLGTLIGTAIPVLAEDNDLKIKLNSVNDTLSLDFYYYNDESERYSYEGYVDIGIVDEGREITYKRETTSKYIIKVLKGSQSWECKVEGNENAEEISEDYIALDINYTGTAASTCLVTYPSTETLTMQYYLYGISEEIPATFTVGQYKGVDLLEEPKAHSFNDFAWPHEDISQEMLVNTEYAKITFHVGGDDINCIYENFDDDIHLSKVTVVAMVQEDGNSCDLYEYGTFTEPPPGPATSLNINLNAIGIVESGKNVVLHMVEYKNNSTDVTPHDFAITEDYASATWSTEQELHDQHDYAKIIMQVGENVGYLCEFADGKKEIENLSKVYVNFDMSRDADKTPCLLYETAPIEGLNIAVNFDFDVDGLRLQLFNIANDEIYSDQAAFILKDESVDFTRSMFMEHSYIIINEIGMVKLNSDIECKFDNDSNIIAPTVGAVTATVVQNEESYTCSLSQ